MGHLRSFPALSTLNCFLTLENGARLWRALNVKSRRLKLIQQAMGRLCKFLRKASADHFRRHPHFILSCCPWQSGPFLSLAKKRVELGDLECGVKAGVWQKQETYFPAASQHLACSALGKIRPPWERPQGTATDELV